MLSAIRFYRHGAALGSACLHPIEMTTTSSRKSGFQKEKKTVTLMTWTSKKTTRTIWWIARNAAN